MQTCVIIATHNRPAALTRLLRSLTSQFSPGLHELFVAENGTPRPSSIDSALPLVHLHDSRPGKCRLQNRAITQAHADLIVCLDDDVIASPCYLVEVERFFRENPQFAAMKGRILPEHDPMAKAGAKAPYMDLPIVDHGEAVLEVRGVLGANMAFRASALARIGLFDERLGPGAAGHEEETEMSKRLRRAGFSIGYAPRALVWHEVDPARATRERFIRIARERGYCRTLHEQHSRNKAMVDLAVATVRLSIARLVKASVERVAREERRLAIVQGIRDGLARP